MLDAPEIANGNPKPMLSGQGALTCGRTELTSNHRSRRSMPRRWQARTRVWRGEFLKSVASLGRICALGRFGLQTGETADVGQLYRADEDVVGLISADDLEAGAHQGEEAGGPAGWR